MMVSLLTHICVTQSHHIKYYHIAITSITIINMAILNTAPHQPIWIIYGVYQSSHRNHSSHSISMLQNRYELCRNQVNIIYNREIHWWNWKLHRRLEMQICICRCKHNKRITICADITYHTETDSLVWSGQQAIGILQDKIVWYFRVSYVPDDLSRDRRVRPGGVILASLNMDVSITRAMSKSYDKLDSFILKQSLPSGCNAVSRYIIAPT